MQPGNGPGADTLTAAYERCRLLSQRYGRSYYLATLLLPAWKRRHVHALYAFARYADEAVDASPGEGPAAGVRAQVLAHWREEFFSALAGRPSGDPLLPAVIHTVRAFGLDPGDFRAFLASMAADLTVTRYPAYEDLLGYMAGSAAAIGTMMLPVLESSEPARAREPARQLGIAFQLTNFIRDVAEDLRRGRVYLPLSDLDTFAVRPADLAGPEPSPRVVRLLEFELDRARGHYRAASEGIGLLAPSSRPCIRAALELYGGILAEIERSGFQVFRKRIRVPRVRRAAIFARHLAAATRAVHDERKVEARVPPLLAGARPVGRAAGGQGEPEPKAGRVAGW